MSRKRVPDDVVSKALVEAGGNLTMEELAENLEMKESTLRAQILRIKSKVTKVAVETNAINFKFPNVKDGRAASSASNAESLLNIFS